MIAEPTSINQVYHLSNKILNKLVRNKFGVQYTIRLNSLKFQSNRLYKGYKCWHEEIVTVKSQKPISLDELNSIQKFILSKINMFLICVELDSYLEVIEVKIISL